jgi:hypothetical protein
MFDLASVTRRAALCGLALSLPMCAGTETDNPLVDFRSTECKHGQELSLAPKIARTIVAIDMEAEAYQGLFCYAWQVNESGTVTIDVINYESGCAIEWSPAETLVDYEHVELGIQNRSCAVAACGSCSYDLTFELAGLTRKTATDLRIIESDCEGERYRTAEPAELPIDRESEGLLCRQIVDDFAGGCGGARQPPCTDEPGELGTCDDGCAEGLACVADVLDDYDVCFTACESDADCGLEIESCQGGACRLRETF